MSKSETIDKIYECFSRGDWPSARKLLLREIRRYSNNSWLLTRLSFVYYNEGKYSKALEISEKAYLIDPNDPVVLWDYARVLLEKDRIIDSIRIFKKLIRMNNKTFYTKGHNKRWSLGIKNDCLFWIAVGYLRLNRLDLAAKYFSQHIANRKRGRPTECSIKKARNFLRGIEKLKEKVNQNELRLWTSLIEVKPFRGPEVTRIKGAYTNGLVMSLSARKAESEFRKRLLEMGYKIVSIEDTEEFERRCLKVDVDQDLKRLAIKVRRTHAAQFDHFCTWGAVKN